VPGGSGTVIDSFSRWRIPWPLRGPPVTVPVHPGRHKGARAETSQTGKGSRSCRSAGCSALHRLRHVRSMAARDCAGRDPRRISTGGARGHRGANQGGGTPSPFGRCRATRAGVSHSRRPRFVGRRYRLFPNRPPEAASARPTRRRARPRSRRGVDGGGGSGGSLRGRIVSGSGEGADSAGPRPGHGWTLRSAGSGRAHGTAGSRPVDIETRGEKWRKRILAAGFSFQFPHLDGSEGGRGEGRRSHRDPD
jgi:hypothetical protein